MFLGVDQLDRGTVGVQRKTLAFVEVKRDQVATVAGIYIRRGLSLIHI